MMIKQNMTIKSFTDLNTWKYGHELVISIYKVTKQFPKQEIYSLVDQMRRSSTSITSNIAEGFGRHSYKEKIQLYYLSMGSLTELKNQLLIARDIGYINEITFEEFSKQSILVSKLLMGLIRKTKSINKVSEI